MAPAPPFTAGCVNLDRKGPLATLAGADDTPYEASHMAHGASPQLPAASSPNDSGQWRAWYDGSALPNPGKIGLGAIVEAPDGRRLQHSSPAKHSGCNNEAELYALCAVLDLAFAAGARRLVATGDSDFVVQHLQGKATTHIERLCALLAAAQERIARFEAVDLRWVPRHRNEEANLLARRALGLEA